MLNIILSLIAWGAVSGILVYINTSKKQLDLKKEKDEEISKIKLNIDDDKRRLNEEKNELEQKKQRLDKMEEKFLEREEKIEKRLEEIEKKLEEIENKKNDLVSKEEEIEKRKLEINKIKEELNWKLAQIASLTQEEAKELILKQTEDIYEKDILAIIEKKKWELKLKEKELSREILIKSIQQYSWEIISETTQTTIHLENDDIKWKLIWKEGRNIIAFERTTGVSLIIDDTPDTVFISSFDLFRRYVAKKSLEQLIEDKRIQPARIEEIVEQNQKDGEKLIYDLWEKTINEMWIAWIPEEIVWLIWKLRFRTSYGQNILTHSKEVAYIAQAIAQELWADAALCLKWWLLHDIGKALDHDIEWTHPEIWGKIARKYNLWEKIINIIEWHHDWVTHTCIETKIIQIADAISAVRPGARRASVEQYIKRMHEMENLVLTFAGVTKAYALSAWREVRIFVDSDWVTDLEAEKLARDIALSIENNLNYPWEVKVNLIREKRITEYAR
ncbi:MAG: hypothetical protein ACD_49C00040G0006 [uncultured bacterium (gcode 4)]|uniref:Ribonuclease Y n=1 Tax=uncultured bacterium (gcode 4) TaxID=1234023 RepID=K2AEH8_9BACT|nr:MAG: hypothetical protein ACD_49C00040G0006 [uncultured bacterium (gcode 4)]